MLESPLPQWLRDQLVEMIDAHLALLPALQVRCQQIAESGRRNWHGDLIDDSGTIDEYRLDGKYIAGQVVRLIATYRERVTEHEWTNSKYAYLTRDPKKLADWAWLDPWQHLRLRLGFTAMDDAPLQWRDFYLLYPERERQALVYTRGCGMSLRETADKMNCTPQAVRTLLSRARDRGLKARDQRAGIDGKRL